MNQVLLKTAIAVAKGSAHRFRVGAVLFSGSNPIKAACNDAGYIGFMRKYARYPSRHAEVKVVLNVSKSAIKGADVLVVRINRKDELAYSKPCSACENFLRASGVRRIHFIERDGSLGKLNLKEKRSKRKT